MLLAFLACSIRLAAAEPDNTSSTNTPSDEDELAVDDLGAATDSLDDTQADDPSPASASSASLAPTWEHGIDAREAALRSHTSWLGRIDVSITWRRALNESTAVQRDEVWLVGTWRL